MTVVRYAAENEIAIHARGAGTGLAGESLGPGWSSTSAAISAEDRRPRARERDRAAGGRPRRPQRAAGPAGPTARADAGGLGGVHDRRDDRPRRRRGCRSLRYGTTGDHVERLRVVFANGEVAELGREPWPALRRRARRLQGRGRPQARGAGPPQRRGCCAARPPGRPRNRAGYCLEAARRARWDPPGALIAGSEGTLALVTEATLRTVPIPPAQAVVRLAVRPDRRRRRGRAPMPRRCRPRSCDLYDWRSLRLARDAVPAFRDWIAEAAEAALIVEFEGDDPDEVAQQAPAAGRRGSRRRAARRRPGRGLAPRRVRAAARPPPCRRAAADADEGPVAPRPVHRRRRGPPRGTPRIPPAAAEHPEAARRELDPRRPRRPGPSFTPDPFLDLADPRDVAKLEPLATQVYEAVLELGGTISGEHGCGLVRTQFLRRQFGELVQVFREIKDAFDPLGLLNPGKVIGDDPHLMTRDLRRFASSRRRLPPSRSRPSRSVPLPAAVILPVLRLDRATRGDRLGVQRLRRLPVAASRPCGCAPSSGRCGPRPATPRAKANLLRQLATGVDRSRALGDRGIQGERRPLHPLQPLPDGMPVGRRRLEPDARGQGGLRREPRPAPQGLALLAGRTLVAAREPAADLDAERPDGPPGGRAGCSSGCSGSRGSASSPGPIARRSSAAPRGCGLNRAAAAGARPPGRSTSSTSSPTTSTRSWPRRSSPCSTRPGSTSTSRPAQRGSGMPALVAGDVDLRARPGAGRTCGSWANAVRDGYTVVCSEPTAALMLRQEYLKLTDDLDAALVAENTMRPRPVPRRPRRARPAPAARSIPCRRGSATISPATSGARRRARPGST